MARNALRLPSFDEMSAMAREQPEALEDLRIRLTEEVIEQASDASKRRLRGLAFVIEAERRKASNPLQACIRLSRLMLDSAVELKASLDLLRTAEPGSTRESRPSGTARVLPFQPRRAGSRSAP
ncbi:DUF3135 domain-containing protein [Halopseudomonas sp.]|jgi:hypothetical protein|uniref:DUF3135 domain-containing protein n=1 Tax=Halopseudomonas sp. TaxID=2901191 RepID=UPI001A5C607B|nr:DUF3135 domain-containing protein [Pseudomonas sp.]